MFRRSPRATALWAGAALVAVLTAVLVVDTLGSLRHQDQAFGRLHPVVVARHDLPVGTRLRAADLGTRRIRGEAPEPDALTARRDALGRVVRVPLLRGTTLTTRHLADAHRAGLGAVVPAGLRAIRLVVEHGLRPQVGDLVDVLATFDPQTLGDDQDPTILVAPAVPVLGVDTAATGGDTVAVTVLVTPRQAARLAFSTASGTLALALAPPEAAAGP
ncbi:MAG: Flp pilus assembly protein CpaB [Acidimicrobiia bacterium]